MFQKLGALLWLCCLPFAALAQEGGGDAPALSEAAPTPPTAEMRPQPMASAINAMQAGEWDKAKALAARAGSIGLDIIEWYRLRDGAGTAAEALAFLDRHNDWPGLSYLRAKSEAAVALAPPDDIIRFFEDELPQTGLGALALTEAFNAMGREAEAEVSLVLAWRTLDLSSAEHDLFLAGYPDLLAPHHAARLDMALWRGLRDVQEMLPLVDETTRAAAEARLDIEAGGDRANTRLGDVPETVLANAGVSYALFNRLLDTNEPMKAIEVMVRQSAIVGGLGEPDRWASWRRALARRMMREGQAELAYSIASVHQLVEGYHYSDLEWLSGYLALRYLEEPALALDHFQRVRAAVDGPISLGRASYWIGRAQEALGDTEAAQLAYAEGAAHGTSFYGQLAAEKAGIDIRADLAAPAPAEWRGAAFVQSDVRQAAELLLNAGALNRAEMFWMHLAETSATPEDLAAMGAMFLEMGQSHLAVRLGKEAADRGVILPAAYYAVHPMQEMESDAPMELSLAIARRESEFDHLVRSPVGAMGLMQLMPGTARDMARSVGEAEHSDTKVQYDWRYNARLGNRYLRGLAREFDGNVILMASGYNAGPGRSKQWLEEYGDFRAGPVINGRFDTVDWIEHIPFRETRNYVMRVAESLPVYRAQRGEEPFPVPFSEEISGATMLPES